MIAPSAGECWHVAPDRRGPVLAHLVRHRRVLRTTGPRSATSPGSRPARRRFRPAPPVGARAAAAVGERPRRLRSGSADRPSRPHSRVGRRSANPGPLLGGELPSPTQPNARRRARAVARDCFAGAEAPLISRSAGAPWRAARDLRATSRRAGDRRLRDEPPDTVHPEPGGDGWHAVGQAEASRLATFWGWAADAGRLIQRPRSSWCWVVVLTESCVPLGDRAPRSGSWSQVPLGNGSGSLTSTW